MIGGIVTRDPITSARERTLSADNTRSQLISPVRRTNFEMERFSSISSEGIRKLVQKAVPESTKKSTCFASCFVLSCFRAAAFAVRGDIWRIIKTINYFWPLKYARIVVLGHYLFLEAHSCPRANCSLLGTDNILGQLSVHISSPKVVYCLYIPRLRNQSNQAKSTIHLCCIY